MLLSILVISFIHLTKLKNLPEKTGYMLLSKIEKASKTERSATASMTSSSLVNIYAIWRPNTKHKTKKNTPTISETPRITLIANFAALAFPLPNSFATRTLPKYSIQNTSFRFFSQNKQTEIWNQNNLYERKKVYKKKYRERGNVTLK